MSIRDQLRIMVVDDMSTSRGLILQALDALGITNVSYTENGLDALTAIKTNPFHLVISDYNMPQMDGLHLLQHMRADAQIAKTGFILITGKPDQQVISTGQQLGMNNFIKKPFTNEEIRHCIEAVVGKL